MAGNRKEHIMRLIAGWNKGDLSVIDEVFAVDVVSYTFTSSDKWKLEGREAYKQAITGWRIAFPDMVGSYTHVADDGDVTAGRWTLTGTNTGPLGDIPPTGKEVSIEGGFTMRWDKGKIVENWTYYDLYTYEQQLGVTFPRP